MTTQFAYYNGKVVQVSEYPREKFDTLVLDAKRLLGLEPVKGITAEERRGKTGVCKLESKLIPPESQFYQAVGIGNMIYKYGDYIDQDDVIDEIKEYAKRIVSLEWPVASIWIGFVVSKSDLTFIE